MPKKITQYKYAKPFVVSTLLYEGVRVAGCSVFEGGRGLSRVLSLFWEKIQTRVEMGDFLRCERNRILFLWPIDENLISHSRHQFLLLDNISRSQ